MTDKDQLLNTILKTLEELPPMPANVIKLRHAVADPNVNYDRLSPILQEDPSICADLLKVANSAVMGVGHGVDTIDEAIRYFGMSALVEFVAVACSDKIIKQSFSAVSHLNEYTQHSHEVSVATSFMAKAFKLSQHDREVFTLTGLLHDIGRLVILLFTEERAYCEEALRMNWQEVHELVDNEKELFGIDHAQLGQMICRKWQFPERIVNGVKMHHTPLIGKHIYKDGLILFLSEIITVDTTPDSVLEVALPPDVMKGLGVKVDDIIEARYEYQDAIAKIG